MAQTPARTPAKGGHTATVLVVDDDADTVATFSEILRDEGYVVLGASNGRDALEAVEGEPRPDVVLLDWSMPVMNGREFLNAVREDSRFDALPVIVLSAEVQRTPNGAVHSMKKPLGPASLNKLFGLMEQILQR